jgi:hypothetical protein
MMRSKNVFKFYTLLMLLFTFIAAGSISACRDHKKQENTEQQGEHPEGDAHSDNEEHPTNAGEEHPAETGDEHPAKEEEHPTKKEE